ncbi:conserved protein of unknown function [Ralstonia solanacearum CMR15]|nr:conserved protein of unknown function [Ralstonia solanacearum CMR15]
MMNRIGSSTSTSTPNLALDRLDTAIAKLQDARRDAVKRNPALALFEKRHKNTDNLLEQASGLSANRYRTDGKSKNDATPDSQVLIDALNSNAESWMKA